MNHPVLRPWQYHLARESRRKTARTRPSTPSPTRSRATGDVRRVRRVRHHQRHDRPVGAADRKALCAGKHRSLCCCPRVVRGDGQSASAGQKQKPSRRRSTPAACAAGVTHDRHRSTAAGSSSRAVEISLCSTAAAVTHNRASVGPAGACRRNRTSRIRRLGAQSAKRHQLSS